MAGNTAQIEEAWSQCEGNLQPLASLLEVLSKVPIWERTRKQNECEFLRETFISTENEIVANAQQHLRSIYRQQQLRKDDAALAAFDFFDSDSESSSMED